jgi:fumarate hydratase subunit beta
MKKITVPFFDECKLHPGDFVELTGTIYCGRDAVLPHIVEMSQNGTLAQYGVDLRGALIFHTAVSCAGIAPTTTSKPEIEGSMVPLSEHGAKFHLGKGRISKETIEGLKKNGAYFLIVPPVAALLTAKMTSKRAVVHPEFGMEAFFEITVEDFPAIVAVANGESIFSE